MAKVVLTSTGTRDFSNKEIDKTVTRALDLLNFNFNSKIKKVIIKPNLCYYWDYSTGETTDPRVVSAVIDYIRTHLDNNLSISIAEADASAMKTKHSFEILGYRRLSEAKNVQLVNLSEGDIVERKVKVGDKELTLPINKALLEADLIINIPKLKTQNVVGVTGALKNIFGAIAKPRKFTYHNIIHHVIVGANKIVRSDISIVDGIIARGSHPKKLGIVLAGDNPLATDFIAAEIMGFNPRRTPYLNMAKKEKIGDVDNIDIVEDQVGLKEVRNSFPSYSHFRHTLLWNLQLKMLKTYAAIVKDVIPPVLE
jgi:uncharacterized protein (DUF362 family)